MGVEKNRVFVKAAVGRAFRLWECPVGELPLYFIHNFSSKLSSVLYTQR